MNRYELKEYLIDALEEANLEIDAESLDLIARFTSYYFLDLLKKHDVKLDYGTEYSS